MHRVLIVEDEDIIRKGLAYTMDWTGMGCVVVGEAANGREGIEKILELKPDIVITDIMMPFVDGIQMIRETKEKVHYKSIILTSYAEFTYAKQAIDLKVSEYLMKPVEEEDIKAAIDKITPELQKEKEIERMYEKQNSGIQMEEYYIRAEKENTYVVQMLKIIEEQYMEKISVENIAEELQVSASYFSRKFKNATGLTYLDFLNQYRIRQAIKLLETGKYKVYEVSDMTGFTDYKHFSVVFKRYTNQSPSDFIN